MITQLPPSLSPRPGVSRQSHVRTERGPIRSLSLSSRQISNVFCHPPESKRKDLTAQLPPSLPPWPSRKATIHSSDTGIKQEASALPLTSSSHQVINICFRSPNSKRANPGLPLSAYQLIGPSSRPLKGKDSSLHMISHQPIIVRRVGRSSYFLARVFRVGLSRRAMSGLGRGERVYEGEVARLSIH